MLMLCSFPEPTDLTSEKEYINLQLKIRERHSNMHYAIAEALEGVAVEPKGLTELLDRFYTSRISNRMTVDQHIAIQKPKPGYVGILANECCPMQVARKVARDITPLCEKHFGKAPIFDIEGQADALYKYIPQHLEAILSELFKNAVRIENFPLYIFI